MLPAPLRSIRFRITFWFTLTVVVIQAASAYFSFRYFSQTLHERIDTELHEVASQIGASYREEGWSTRGKEGCDHLQELIHRGNWHAYIQLYNGSMQPLCRSDNLRDGELAFGAVARQQARKLNTSLETVEVGDGEALRLISLPVIDGHRLLGVVQVARTLGPILGTMENLRVVYLLVAPFAIFWLGIGCWLLAGRYVSPLVTVSEAARTIDADNLWRRLPVVAHRDELGSMVENFNQMLDRFEAAFRRIRQFSGDASHELRTPLTIIRGETEVALRWVKEPDEFREVLRSNLEEIERMERIIEQLLLLAKSEVDELTMELRNLDLTALMQGISQQARILGEAKQMAVTLHLDSDEGLWIHADELRLRQMLLNLIANGIKYSPPGGSLELSLARVGSLVRIDIRDSGIGIPAEDQPFIFDRFYRVDKARNRNDGGTGLGLAIVKAIATEHGGHVSVASTPGKGSTFTVLLPLAGPPEEPEGATAPA